MVTFIVPNEALYTEEKPFYFPRAPGVKKKKNGIVSNVLGEREREKTFEIQNVLVCI